MTRQTFPQVLYNYSVFLMNGPRCLTCTLTCTCFTYTCENAFLLFREMWSLKQVNKVKGVPIVWDFKFPASKYDVISGAELSSDVGTEIWVMSPTQTCSWCKQSVSHFNTGPYEWFRKWVIVLVVDKLINRVCLVMWCQQMDFYFFKFLWM